MFAISAVAKRGLVMLAKQQMRLIMSRPVAMFGAPSRAARKGLGHTFAIASRAMSSYPAHLVVPMPALSPTMETGSIVSWNKKAGDRFEAGDAICEVETDKATVAYEATDGGYLAKILINSGEVKVGQPIMITVEEEGDIAAFASYTSGAASPTATPKAVAAPVAAQAAVSSSAAAVSSAVAVSAAPTTGRVVASPFARKLAAENGISINAVGAGSGPGGRIIAEDVTNALKRGVTAAPAPIKAAPPAVAATASAPVKAAPASVAASTSAGCDFTQSPIALALGGLFATSKKTVPHYHLSVELNMTKVKQLCDAVNARKSTVTPVTAQSVVFKAAALAMRKVPVANATFMDSFVRCYDKVDINVFMGSGDAIAAPLLRDAAALGITDIATKVAGLSSSAADGVSTGTFSIHDLGAYGVKSAAAIVLPPQSTALALGCVRDTVVPRSRKVEGEPVWEIAPMMVATLACDHRVVDGAVGAEWLSVFKGYVEDPTSMIL